MPLASSRTSSTQSSLFTVATFQKKKKNQTRRSGIVTRAYCSTRIRFSAQLQWPPNQTRRKKIEMDAVKTETLSGQGQLKIRPYCPITERPESTQVPSQVQMLPPSGGRNKVGTSLVVLVTHRPRVLSEGDKRDSKSNMPGQHGRSYFAPEPASRTRPRRTSIFPWRNVERGQTAPACCSRHELVWSRLAEIGANRCPPVTMRRFAQW